MRFSDRSRSEVWEDVELRTILIPLDGSLRAERALPYAEALAAAGHSRLVLVRAVRRLPFTLAPDGQGLVDEAEQYLERLAVALPYKVGISVLIGDPAPVIAREAWSRQADIVIMAISARARPGGYLHDSVAERVLAHTRVPVLLVRARQADLHARKLISHPRVIVPLDGSPGAEAALPVAAGLVEAVGGKLLLVRGSAAPAFLATGTMARDVSVAERLRVRARTYLRLVADSLARVYRIPRPRVEVLPSTPLAALAQAIHTHRGAVVAMALQARVGRSLAPLERMADVALRGQALALLLVRSPAVAPLLAGAA